MKTVKMTMNGKELAVPAGITVLEAAKLHGIYIPTLCAYEGMKPKAACRLCLVRIEGEEGEKLACATKVREGMTVVTDDEALFAKRKAAVQEMFRQHTVDCHHCLRIGSTKAKDFDPAFCRDCYFCDCVRDGFCELQAKALEFGVDELPFEIHEHDFAVDDSTGSVVRNPNKCIKCRRCTDVCKTQGVGILGMVKTDRGQTVGAKNGLLADGCIRCGRCVDVCPTGALFMREHKDEEIYFAHQYGTATAALVSADVLPELERLFRVPEGSFTLEQVAEGLKKIGIDRVYDSAEAQRAAEDRAAGMLDGMAGDGCVLVARNYAAKNYLEKHFPELRDRFLLLDSAQQIFSETVRKESPETKLYSVSGCNSLGAEAHETGNADYFLNARELYRVFLRTGVNPSLRRGVPCDSLGIVAEGGRYAALLHCSGWQLNGEAEELTFSENGREIRALVCHNAGQVKQAVESMDRFDIIYVIG